ncbi:MAG: hypothetical protein H7Z14_16345 [Anaerolineae bacterium]|nr:hypothetical protein [Phycisphaerae bacterium]
MAGDDVFTLRRLTAVSLDSSIEFNGDAGKNTIVVTGQSSGTENLLFADGAFGYVGHPNAITYTEADQIQLGWSGAASTLHVSGGAPIKVVTRAIWQSLLVDGNGRVTLDAPQFTNGFAIADQGIVDLAGSRELLVNHAPGGPTPIATIQTYINRARTSGTWNGLGLFPVLANNAPPARNVTVGLLESADYKAIYGANASFGDFAMDASCVLIKPTFYGDTDLDGAVDFDDYSRIDAGFNNNRTGWLNGDVDGNGIVDFDDYSLIDQAFNTQGSALRPAVPPLGGKPSKGGGVAVR